MQYVKKKWKFRTKEDVYVNLKRIIGDIEDYTFYDTINGVKKVVGYISGGILVILKGYEWDGCTPKILLFKRLWGVPDFKGTWKASLVHDFLIEYCSQHSLSRKKIDCAFQEILKQKKFILRFVYANAVHLFRPIAVRISPCYK